MYVYVQRLRSHFCSNQLFSSQLDSANGVEVDQCDVEMIHVQGASVHTEDKQVVEVEIIPIDTGGVVAEVVAEAESIDTGGVVAEVVAEAESGSVEAGSGGCAVDPQPMHPFTVIPNGFGAELLDYIGAHHLDVLRWDCDHCSPRWYDWWCYACQDEVPSRWTVEDHFSRCGQSCPCCRARVDDPVYCDDCFSISCVQMVDKRCRNEVVCARAAGAPL